MSTMTLDGYTARITFDSELDQFRGEIVGLNGGADFYGKTPTELRREFRKSLKVYLEVCQEKGINPRRQFSGRFNLRINPELHQRLATLADASGESLNTLVEETLTKVFQGKSENTTEAHGPAKNSFRKAVADDVQNKFTRPVVSLPSSSRFVQSKKMPSARTSVTKSAKLR